MADDQTRPNPMVPRHPLPPQQAAGRQLRPPGFGEARTPLDAVATTSADLQTTLGPSLGRGLLFGLGAGLLAGFVWFGIVVLSERQIYYLAVLLGLAIGAAVTRGAGRGGLAAAAVAAPIALATVLASYFYVDRWFIVKAADDQGYTTTLGLWPRYDQVKEVLRAGFEADASQYLFCLLAMGGAAWAAWKGRTTPIGPHLD